MGWLFFNSHYLIPICVLFLDMQPNSTHPYSPLNNNKNNCKDFLFLPLIGPNTVRNPAVFMIMLLLLHTILQLLLYIVCRIQLPAYNVSVYQYYYINIVILTWYSVTYNKIIALSFT